MQTGYIDYDKLEEKALDFRPKLVICGGSAYPREWDYSRLSDIATKLGAYLLCDMAHIRCRADVQSRLWTGIAASLTPSPASLHSSLLHRWIAAGADTGRYKECKTCTLSNASLSTCA